MPYLLIIFLMCCQLAAAADLPSYQDRFGRERPVVAVVGFNGGTELTDFVVPYGILARSGAAQVLAVATQAGPLKMRPALTIQPDLSTEAFDARFREGADYVIVPAVVKPDDPALVAWIAAQGAKGATVVSICDGAFVVANAGLMRGRRATAHWASESYRKKQWPDTQWIGNVRYVADGKLMSSAGVSAALPAALALVEAIAGRERATDVARQVGVEDWSARHDSDAFRPRLGVNLGAYITGYTNQWFHSPERLGLPVAAGVDEVTLAFAADAWARSKRSRILTVAASAEPLRSGYGLTILPDRQQGAADMPEMLPADLQARLPGQELVHTLEAMAQRYGHRTAFLVALELEFPSYR
jgi:transcriptional regulator GlxA family with amidase domain